MPMMASSIERTERAPALLNDKFPSSSSSLLCSECSYPITEPRQTSCGCRICGKCFSSFLEKNELDAFVCKRCGQYFTLNETFKDRAVESELKRTSFPCCHPKCPWSGPNTKYREHIADCKYATLICPNPDCGYQTIRKEMESHLSSCSYVPSNCHSCGITLPANKMKDHVMNSCPEQSIECPNGCEESIIRKELDQHLSTYCKLQKRPCRYTPYGCHQKDTLDNLLIHYSNDAGYHLGLLEKLIHDGALMNNQRQLKESATAIARTEIANQTSRIDQRIESITESLLRTDMKIGELQESFQEISLLVQTLQATSYSGQFIWKIPEVSRRRIEAKSGKTVSLYSAPFYTSRFGYKLCLRLYLDGDGSGKRTHISFFLTIMRGEYDALLVWPFAQMVTLMLLDQSGGKKNIVQCFKPEPTSSSFWQPQTEMNVASGCPKFAPLSVLNDPTYVKDDSMFFKVLIDTSTLTQP